MLIVSAEYAGSIQEMKPTPVVREAWHTEDGLAQRGQLTSPFSSLTKRITMVTAKRPRWQTKTMKLPKIIRSNYVTMKLNKKTKKTACHGFDYLILFNCFVGIIW